ncbi:MAG: BrnT family toxin [Crocosphaera sp.]|jgi:uncharacterized DUF497 family protein
MRYDFDWDAAKNKQNYRKHKVNFRQAATVFSDPYQLSIYDEDHSQQEDRWITIGMDYAGVLRVVVHTFETLNDSLCQVRIVSARKANSEEVQQYYQRRQ